MLKAPDLTGIPQTVRSFILLCVALSFAAWDIGFELGVYGRIFFPKLFMVWSIATALLIALVITPRERLQVPTLAILVTAFPSIWLMLVFLFRASPNAPWLGVLLFVAGLLVYLACFPYVIYMGVSIAYPELITRTERRLKITLAVIALALLGAGYLMGRNHPHLISCEDFDIAGQHVPENCRPEAQRLIERLHDIAG